MFGERKNAGRFELLEDLEMDRLQFSRQIRQKELGFTTNQLDHVFAFPGKKIFEVVFTNLKIFESFCDRFSQKKKESPAFKKIYFTPLSERDLKMS